SGIYPEKCEIPKQSYVIEPVKSLRLMRERKKVENEASGKREKMLLFKRNQLRLRTGLAARNPTALTLGYARTLQRGAAWLSSNALPDIAKRRWHPIGPTDRTCKPASLD
ncbi:hypothetical protein V1478_008312, partial [Vespula squamosa]